MTGLHPLEPERVDRALRDLGSGPVGPEERAAGEILVELRAVDDGAEADLVERLDRQAAGIGRRLQHQRRNGGNQRDLGHPFRAVTADIAGDFAAARGEADQDGTLQVERFDELREVVGIGVHIVATPWLARPAMATTVVGDAAIAVGGQEHHLSLPAIRTEGPAVAEHQRLSCCCAPVLVIDVRTVFGRDRAHRLSPLPSTDSRSPLSRAIGAQRPYFTCGNFVSLSVFRKATMSSTSESVSFRFPMSFYPGSGRPSRAHTRLRCNNSHGTTRLPHQTTRRRHVSGTKGTFWAHLWRTEHSLPLVASGEYAGRPACFADGPTDHPGAPKGIRNLTCGFQEGSACFAECRIVAGHEACAVSVGFTAAQPDSGCLQGVSCVQGTRMARTHAIEPTRDPGRFTSYDSARAGSS